jgi:DNA-binding IclR family transcriptional regulator
MPCISPDGKPSATGLTLLRSLKGGSLSPSEVSEKTGLTLPRVRSGLRELRAAGFVEESEGRYGLSQAGAEAVA